MAAGIGHNQPAHVSVNSLSNDDRLKVKNAVQALNDSMTRVAAERELQNEVVNDLFDKLGVNKKLVKRMARAYYKANFNDEVEENNSFEDFYTLIIKKPEEKL